jgi:superfamily I DNA/RNA helicase/CRISPR/Cas system-associated exonuclease Cas4 (RecB family)
MPTASDPSVELTGEQRRVLDHAGGALILSGPAGSGKTEALANRVAALVAAGVPPQSCLVLTRSRAAADRLRGLVESQLEVPFEELWIETWERAAQRLLRQEAQAAGLDPFFAPVGPAERLAMLLERLDELPLRRHEIRGNPAGVLAGLLGRIDVLKVAGVRASGVLEWATGFEEQASDPAELERARRELEFAELYERHDEILRRAGTLDDGELILELGRLLSEHAEVAARIGTGFPELIVDELEDAGPAHADVLNALGGAARSLVVAIDEGQAIRGSPGHDALARFRGAWPDAEEVRLEGSHRCSEEMLIAASAALSPPDAPQAPDDPSFAGNTVDFWRCRTDRAQAQAVAREIEHLLGAGDARPESICVIVPSGRREGRVVEAAFEERGLPVRTQSGGALFRRPEVRDVIAWLRMLADPNDTPAVVRALTRPPVDLRSVDLARCSLIARRRKLDLVSALEAALESPQLPPEARDRIRSFLKLQSAASAAMAELRADVFVRRLIERVGFRRQSLFAASPETAERLLSLSRLGEVAADWTRREPQASTADFVRYLAAVADAELPARDEDPGPAPAAVRLMEPGQAKGHEFDHVYLLGLDSRFMPGAAPATTPLPHELLDDGPADADRERLDGRRRLLYTAMTRARRRLILSYSERIEGSPANPSPFYEDARRALGARKEVQEEELFGAAEGVEATYRMIRDEVLETSWKAGGALGELRLDTAVDVNRAVARFLELIKLAALVQRPDDQPTAEAIEAVNELIGRSASEAQRQALTSSALDSFLLERERERELRRELIAERQEPSLDAFLPRKGKGLVLSASDLDLYRTCPLKYKFARVFAIPQEPTVNQRFGILVHQVLERFEAAELRRAGGGGEEEPGEQQLRRLLRMFDAGWKRAGFGDSDDELQYRERGIDALVRYQKTREALDSDPVWIERRFAFPVGPHQVRGRVDRVDRRPDGDYELIDYKTGERRESADDVQLPLYRLGAREAWGIEANTHSYWYVLEDEKVDVPGSPDDAERVERTVLEVGQGIMGQDFEPRPSPEVCSWCDYRLICPAAEI